MKLWNTYPEAILLVLGTLFFVPFLGSAPLFDWDEINFAECAREMIASGDYFTVTINFVPFWEKPPLFIWMQVLSMKTFGITEFAARFPNAVCGIITLLVLFKIGSRVYGKTMGGFWALFYLGSLLPHFYFKSGIIDPWFNLFIFLSVWHAIRLFNRESEKMNAVLSGLFLGLAILTKGPVAGLIFLLCAAAFFGLGRMKDIPKISSLMIFSVLALSVSGLWFFILWLSGNGHIISEFITYQIRLFSTEDAGHGGPFFYHALLLLGGCFPASFFALKKSSLMNSTPFSQVMGRSMSILFWVVLILFSVVKTKIIHYSSLAYFPITFFAARAALGIAEQKTEIKRLLRSSVFIFSVLLGLVFSSLPFVNYFREFMSNSKDPFLAAALTTEVSWQGWEWIGGIFLIAAGFIWRYGKVIDFPKNLRLLLILNALAMFVSLAALAPRVELYTQGPARAFFESKSGSNCRLGTLGYKSYAHLFYGKVTEGPFDVPSFLTYYKSREKEIREGLSLQKAWDDWLLYEKPDKEVYFSAKINQGEELKEHPNLDFLYQEGGYLFFRRKNADQ
jgi:4-amino-4-deoxy-L-arabinose transferase-like glycosyltransferase